MGQSGLADWIAAIGRAVGAIGTLAAVVVALSIARQDGRRLQREQREREASQARMTTTRTERTWEEIVNGQESGIIISNNSVQSVLAVKVLDGLITSSNLQWFPDDAATIGLEALAPHTSHQFAGTWRSAGPDREGPLSVRTRIRFVDSSGTWWERTNDDEPVHSYG